MDSFEFNKIAAAVLAALLIMIGTPTLLEIVRGGHGDQHGEAKAGYKLPDPVGGASSAGGTTAAAAKGFDFNNVAGMVATASVDAGKAAFKKCAACHTVNDGGKDGIGPNLWDIVGRKRAGHAGFQYSKAMAEKGGEWDYASIAEFVHKPKAWLSGTKMAFAGISNDKELASLLLYLQTLSASPKPLPAPK